MSSQVSARITSEKEAIVFYFTVSLKKKIFVSFFRLVATLVEEKCTYGNK